MNWGGAFSPRPGKEKTTDRHGENVPPQPFGETMSWFDLIAVLLVLTAGFCYLDYQLLKRPPMFR
jgi:hypothetical protein